MKLYMAPIKGITNAIFRNVFTECFSGFDLAVAPFVSTIQGRKISRSHIRDILPENNTGIPIVPQLMSNNGDDFIHLARKLHDLGYDTVNWNLGCPFPMVANKKRGSGMLLYPERIDAFLSQVIPKIPVNLSIKCRLGRNQDEEILKLIPVFNRYPLKELIIHPRTGIQMYEGSVHLDRFEECTNQLKHSIVYNGDITCLDGFRNLSVRFPQIDTWMIGRGTLINPFLPEILKKGKDDISDKIQKMQEFHDSLWKQYQSSMSGPSHAMDKMKGFWYYFSQAFQNKAEIYKKIKKTKSMEKFENVVWNVFHHEKLIIG
ncbi:MAG: tRNA-dihydrouridine synthase family protein [Desulfobacteraceae bacterium]|nr:MAG: tRNA-dihydrouridine synthase family protein [Desulfobacteraceae bacterium]